MKPNPTLRRFLAAVCPALFAALHLGAPPANAATFYWDGTSASWNSASNWSTASDAPTPDPGAVPGALDDLIFNITSANGAETITLDANQAAKSLTFNNTGTTALTGGGTDRTLTLGPRTAVTLGASAGAVTLGDGTAGNNVLISLAAGAQTWTNNSAADFTFNNTVATFSRSAGSTLVFNKLGAGNFAVTSGVSNTNSIVGPWAFFGTGTSTRYATVSGGNIAGFTGTTQNTATNWTSSTTNYEVTSTGSKSLGTGARTGNTFRYSGVGNGDFQLGSGSTTLTTNGILAVGSSGTLTISGTGTTSLVAGSTGEIVIAGTQAVTISANISSGALTKDGTGKLILSGDNTYTGTTTLTTGPLEIQHANALGSTAGNTIIQALGSTRKLQLNGTFDSAEPITITGSSTAIESTVGNNTLSGNITLDNLTGAITIRTVGNTNPSLTLSGTITQLTSSQTLQLGTRDTGSTLTVDNAIANNGGDLDIYGSNGSAALGGRVILKGASTAIGNTRIYQYGTLQLGIDNALKTTGDLTIGSTTNATGFDVASFDLAGFSQTVNALNSETFGGGAAGTSRTVTNSVTGTSLLTVGNGGGSGLFDGTIQDGGAGKVVALTKTGAGTQELTGSNTYTGATMVNAGTLLVNGSLAEESAVTVAANGILGGSGTISGATTIDGFHAPGNSPGIQTFGGGLTYNGTSTLTWELIDNTAAALDRGVDYDGVDVTGGAFQLVTGADIDLAFSGAVDFLNPFWAVDQEWLVVDLSGGATASDTNLFTIGSITGGANYSPSLGTFGIERKPGSNAADSVYLTWVAVPEPSALALAGLGIAGVAAAVVVGRRSTSPPPASVSEAGVTWPGAASAALP